MKGLKYPKKSRFYSEWSANSKTRLTSSREYDFLQNASKAELEFVSLLLRKIEEEKQDLLDLKKS